MMHEMKHTTEYAREVNPWRPHFSFFFFVTNLDVVYKWFVFVSSPVSLIMETSEKIYFATSYGDIRGGTPLAELVDTHK